MAGSTPLLGPAPRQLSDEARIRDTVTMQLGPEPTFNPAARPDDRRAVAAVADARPRVLETSEEVQRLRRERHSPGRKRMRDAIIVALFVVELVGVRLSLTQAGLEEPLPTLIALGVTLGSFGLAVWASQHAGRLQRALGITLLVLLVGGIGLLRFAETSGEDESPFFSVGRALVLVASVAIPVVLAEWLLRQRVENKRTEERLAALEPELAEAETALRVNEQYIDGRHAEMLGYRDRAARLEARLRLGGTSSTPSTPTPPRMDQQ